MSLALQPHVLPTQPPYHRPVNAMLNLLTRRLGVLTQDHVTTTHGASIFLRHPLYNGDTDMISDTTRIDSVLEGENAGVGIAELACRSVEADPNVNPSAFKPLQFVALVDSKSLGNLEKLGGIEGLLHGLGTNPRRGLHIDTNCCRRLGQSWSTDLDQGINSAVTPPGVELTLVPVPASPATARSAFGVDRSASLKLSVLHEATIEDRQRILPQRPNKHLLTLVLLTLHNKVLVSPNVPPIPWI